MSFEKASSNLEEGKKEGELRAYQVGSRPESLLDNPHSDTILDERPDLPEDLSSEKNDGGGSVSDLSVLSSSDVDERLCCWVNDIEELEDGGPVVGDGSVSLHVEKA